MSLSRRALQLIRFVETFFEENHYGPSYEEMCEGIGLKSKSNISRYLQELRIAKRVDYIEGVPRAIWLSIIKTIRIPVAGSISAGSPIPFINRLDPDTFSEFDFLTLTADWLPHHGKGQLVAMRVNGDSMTDANIQDGDWILLGPIESVREGEMYAFWIEDEQAMTLKRYYRDGDIILLQPANTRYATKPKHKDLVEARGKVIQVIRSYH